MLEGRYNIATKSIPAETVEQIDILKRHNHAKIDKGFTFSDNVAINLKLKENRSLIFGKSKINLGIPFLTREIDITPIYINNKVQDILTAKNNNTGQSLLYIGASLTSPNSDLGILNKSDIKILEPPNTRGNYLDDINWLNNNSSSFTNDFLIKNNKDFTNKVALTYNNENTFIQKRLSQFYFFGSDTTSIVNNFDNSFNTCRYIFSTTQEINKKKFYLNNKLIFEKKENDGISEILQNNDSIKYLYNKNLTKIENTTNIKFKIRNKILDSKFFFGLYDNNENNKVLPLVFENIIPTNQDSEETSQEVLTRQIYLGGITNLEANYGNFKTIFKQRLFWKKESLESILEQLPSSTGSEIFPFVSDFNQTSFNSETILNTRYRINKWFFFFESNLRFVDFKTREILSENNINKNFLLIQPSLKVQYRINNKWSFSISNKYFSTLSEFEELYSGLILKSFNSLNSNPNNINRTDNNLTSFFITFNDILRSFIFNNYFYYNNSQSDFITNIKLGNDGFFESEAIPFVNKRFFISNSTKFEKTFFNILKTKLSYTFNKTNFNQVFNNILQETTSRNHLLKSNFNLDSGSWYNFEYQNELNWGNTKSDSFDTNNFVSKHNINLDLFTSNNSRVNIESETIQTKTEASGSNINSLLNFSFYYKPTKKIFLNAKMNNIFNQKFFFTNLNNPNFISESRFSLRPRQFTVGVEFLF